MATVGANIRFSASSSPTTSTLTPVPVGTQPSPRACSNATLAPNPVQCMGRTYVGAGRSLLARKSTVGSIRSRRSGEAKCSPPITWADVHRGEEEDKREYIVHSPCGQVSGICRRHHVRRLRCLHGSIWTDETDCVSMNGTTLSLRETNDLRREDDETLSFHIHQSITFVHDMLLSH